MSNLLDLGYDRRVSGCNIVTGVDEVGRGSLVGPVYAAAVVLREDFKVMELRDSKKLTKLARIRIHQELLSSSSVCYAVGSASVDEIEQYNIRHATFLAMARAVEALSIKPEYILVDGDHYPDSLNQYPGHYLIGGDGISPSIAAASIIAKVERDKLLVALHDEYPQYGWNKNAGYGTAQHKQAIKEFGLNKYHRKGWNI